ncbi:MAG: AlpA family phage regulatory protein [Acinetobacter sp.]|nr:AlpA family phage regulatory protein [Candidatus Methylopumilus sp.]MBP8006807.1 AlpA family phage regulatory protein [Acinetobacter sp.]
MSDNNQLRYLRLYQIIGCRKRGIQPIIPVGPTTWWNGVKSGKFPKPTKLTPRTTVWRSDQIYHLIKP